MHTFFHVQVLRVGHREPGTRVEELGLRLVATQPFAPHVESALVPELVVLGVAEDQVQPRDLLPDHAHIRLPGAVEGNDEQHGVFRLQHADAHRVDLSDALHRVGQCPNHRVLKRRAACRVQCAKHLLDAGLVCHGVERRHEAALDGRDHGQVRLPAHAASLDRRFASHGALPLVRRLFLVPRCADHASRQREVNMESRYSDRTRRAHPLPCGGQGSPPLARRVPAGQAMRARTINTSVTVSAPPIRVAICAKGINSCGWRR